MIKPLLLTAVLLFALVAAYQVNNEGVSANREDTSQFIVAILRADGTLVPFAQYGNGGWTNPWPRPRQPAESIYAEAEATEVIPHSLGGLPEPWFKQCGQTPKTWYFWSSADMPTVLNASKVVQVDNHSETNWALLTDFPKKNATNTHHENVGVALTVNEKVEPLIQIKTDSAEAADVVSFVKELFNEIETTKLSEIRKEQLPATDWPGSLFSLSREQRAKVKVSISDLYRTKSRLGGEHLYYFEAGKEYENSGPPNDRGCNDVSLFQGWVSATERGGLGLMDSRIFFTNCDRKGPSSATPLGIMKLKNAIFLFVSEHGWESESYVIIELDNSGLSKVLETFGG